MEIPPDLLSAVLQGPLGACMRRRSSGWDVSTDVGEPIVLRRGEHTLDPFAAVAELVGDGDRARHWRVIA